eukprot:3207101-Lingulodinium_polyedra.AAC.1
MGDTTPRVEADDDPCSLDERPATSGHDLRYWTVSVAAGTWCQACNKHLAHARKAWRCAQCRLAWCTSCKNAAADGTAPELPECTGAHPADAPRALAAGGP